MRRKYVVSVFIESTVREKGWPRIDGYIYFLKGEVKTAWSFFTLNHIIYTYTFEYFSVSKFNPLNKY